MKRWKVFNRSGNVTMVKGYPRILDSGSLIFQNRQVSGETIVGFGRDQWASFHEAPE